MAAEKGNSHARLNDKSLDSYLHVLCLSSDKKKWERAARKEDFKLAAWVRRTLNEKAKKS